jgi:Ca2+-binding EF-hand superfamily protein
MCAIASSVMLARAETEEPVKSLSVPVISVPAASSDSEPRMAPAQPAPAAAGPTLPDAKLPQYRLVSSSAEERIEEAALRFLLALPAEPVLIEARVSIDEEPFRKKREQRLRAALKAALDPETKSSPPAETREEEAVNDAPTPDGKDDSVNEEAVETPSTSAYQEASSEIEKLRRYIASIGREPSIEEVRWFFDNRLDGPAVLLLKDGFQAFRSSETPVFHILDRNRDGAVSSEEIEQAKESFLDCDLNRDGIVTYRELSEAAKDPRRSSVNPAGTSSLLYLLPTEKNADEVYAQLLSRYDAEGTPATTLPERFDANANGQWEPGELENLRTMPADITINVAFNSDTPGKSSLSLNHDSLDRLAQHEIKAEILNSSILLKRPDCEVWLSAIQQRSGDQVALGAVADGYPMLPVLDSNDDGRFTIRELRGMTEAVRKFDTNGDSQILKAELRPTIRVCFGLGPSVHQALAGVRSVHQKGSVPTAGPEWFVRMDRNKDNDLTRQEFPGTDEQFRALDADHDELVSGDEALEYEKSNSPTNDKQPRPEATKTTESPQETAPDTDK